MSDLPSERISASLEKIAEALTRLAVVAEHAAYRQFPIKREAEDATITRLPTDEDKLRESLGDTGETFDEWIGLREQELLDKSPTPKRTPPPED